MTKTHMFMNPSVIDVVNRLKELKDRAMTEADEMQSRHEEELRALDEKVKAEHQTLWKELTDAAGIAESSPDGVQYQMDSQYLKDHGVIFLKEIDNRLVDSEDDCDCPICVARRARGEPPEPSLADIFKEALRG